MASRALRTFRRTGLLLLAAVLVWAAAAQPAVAQRGVGRMQGQITDPEGNGLAGVQIVATNPDATPSERTGESGDGGRWAMVGFSRGNWTFLFTLDGYVPQEVTASVSAANRNADMNVVMVPNPTGAGAMGAGTGAVQPELFNEGNAMYEAGDYAGAIAKWEEFLAVNPELHPVYGNIGNAYRELGDVAQARGAYEKLLAVEPANTMANYNLGEMLVEDGQLQEAMPFFEAVLETAPDDPAVYYNVAELYFSQQEMEPAIRYYNSALEVDPNYLPARIQLGFAYVRAGDTTNAITTFEKYIELAPEDDPQLPIVRDVLAALRSG